MKSFLQYITEDIELIHIKKNTRFPTLENISDVYFKNKVKYGSKGKNHGEIHPGYELHQFTRVTPNKKAAYHSFHIVDKKSQNVVGHMGGWAGKFHPIKGVEQGLKGKGIKVQSLEMHSDYRSGKIGKSLPIEMYRYLHRKGYTIQSDSVQSHGAAHIWNTMRNDKELKKHIMIHDDRQPLRGEMHTFIKRAYQYPENKIWSQFSRHSEMNQKVKPEYGVDPEFNRTLVLTGKKNKKR